jgi:hypothetical protein
MGDKAVYSMTGRGSRDTSTSGEPGKGEAEQGPAFETAMPQEMRIDAALRDGQAQIGNEHVIELFPHVFGVGFFDFHD